MIDTSSLLSLAQNASLLLALAYIFDVIASRWHTGQSSFQQALVGLAIGAIGITIMLTPWTFGLGIVFDTRSVLLGISGLFFGSLTTVIAMAMAATFRFYQGGTGAWTGVAVILTSGAIGITWRYFRRRSLAEISWCELYLFGMVIHLVMLGLMFTLPWETALRVLSNIALPVISICPLGIAMLGVLIVNRLQHERAEEVLRDTQTRYRLLFEQAPDGIVIIDPNTARLLEFNETAHRQLGYSREEFAQLNISNLEACETPEETRSRIAKVIQEGRNDFETLQRTRQGEIRNVHVIAHLTDIKGHRVYHCIWRDITERKQAEAKLRQQTDAMDTAIDGMALLNAKGEYVYINKAHAKVYGYENVEELIGKSWRILYDSDVIQRFDQKIMPEFSEKGDWHGEAIGKKKNGSKFPQELSLTAMANGGLICVVRDITERKRMEEKLQHILESLRNAVGTTIQVMVSAVETRDPYTAGHQTRSADLARAIAIEMGLPQDKIEGIRVAGSIHDIGKLSIPAEILSKPTKLSAIELSLIQEHARQGYEILKDVESPWPLAEIVRQHHERMDGSGYPRNLKGKEILIEARILTVADVVEAMASHRPYRPGLGIDAALNEIEKNRGILYDNAVADACLKLFREKGLILEGGMSINGNPHLYSEPVVTPL